MKLVRKLGFAVSISICLLLGIRVYFRREEERREFRTYARRDHAVLGGALATAVESVWERDGLDAAVGLIQRVNRDMRGKTIRFVLVEPDARPPFVPRAPALIPRVGAPPNSQLTMDADVPSVLTYARVDLPGDRDPAIEVYEPLTEETAFLGRFVNRFVVTTAVIVGTCALLIFGYGVLFVAKPLRRLMDKADRIGRGDLSGPVQVRQNDEVRELAQALNEMCERLREAREMAETAAEARMRAVTQLRHADRLRTVGELASGIAHQMGTPLNVVRGRGAMIASGEVNETRMRELGAIVVEQADRVSDTIRRLLDYSRRQVPNFVSADLAQVVQQSVRLVDSLANERNVRLDLKVPREALTIALDAGQIHQALTNLIVNAVHASPKGQTVSVSVGRVGDEAVVSVADHGKGISEEQVPHVFEPFYTTKRAGEGTGLGLSVADGIVREHGGHIAVESRAGEGARFSVHLPVRTIDVARASVQHSQLPA
jgi:signal transduction histidine kinase